MKYRWLFIVGITVIALVAAMPPAEKIRLGLDLKGGIHLVVRVVTDDAVKAELDAAVSRVILDLREKTIEGSVVKELDADADEFLVRISEVPADAVDRARKAVTAALPDFKVEPTRDGAIARLPPNRVDDVRSVAVEQALNTIRERIDARGVAEPRIQRAGLGGDRILIQLPGVTDPEAVKRVIGRVAFLALKWVESGPHPDRQAALGAIGGTLAGNQELAEGSTDAGDPLFYILELPAVVTGADLARAQPARDQFGFPAVSFTMNPEGARKLGEGTRANIGRLLAIVLDGRVESAPVVKGKISDSGIIEGSFTDEEARELSLVLRSGALPAKIQYLEERTVAASLGRASIDRGVFTALVGIVLVSMLMMLYYRLAGVNALVALVLNAILLLGALALLDATLTLPGIAGFILTLGMAVDANVLVFEAIRENIRAGASPKRSIEAGFERAFTTIVDSNLTTLLAAGALWMIGSGPVRGFGVTLFIGLIVNMFTAYYVSKTIFEARAMKRDWKPGETLSI